MGKRAGRTSVVVALLAMALSSITVLSAAPVGAETPEWLPLRKGNGGPITVGCTYHSVGSCAGYHPYWAIDFLAPVGTPVYAAGGGRVWSTRAGATGTCSATSNFVLIDHGGSFTYYTHLDRVLVAPGDPVTRNDQIGTVGRSGLASDGCAPHLHYEKRSSAANGTQINPGTLLACHGSSMVVMSGWSGTTWGYPSDIYSDGTGCPRPQRGVADINRDSYVDIFDMNILITNWGSSPTDRRADVDSDGDVDIRDFNELIIQWSPRRRVSSASTTASLRAASGTARIDFGRSAITAAPGSEVTIDVILESDEPINAIAAVLDYPADALTHVRTVLDDGSWSMPIASDAQPGQVAIEAATQTPVSGLTPVARVTFAVRRDAVIQLSGHSGAYSATANTDVLSLDPPTGF